MLYPDADRRIEVQCDRGLISIPAVEFNFDKIRHPAADRAAQFIPGSPQRQPAILPGRHLYTQFSTTLDQLVVGVAHRATEFELDRGLGTDLRQTYIFETARIGESNSKERGQTQHYADVTSGCPTSMRFCVHHKSVL